MFGLKWKRVAQPLAEALCEWSRTQPRLDPPTRPRFGGVFALGAAAVDLQATMADL